jgi:Fur family ferric uptake transcriptional regulator
MSAPRLRSTRQRTAVAKLLDDIEDFRSAQEIHEKLRRRGEGIGLTTVYRTLQSLAEAGEVDVLRTANGEAVYRRCSSHHHHHLVCRDCGRTVEVEGPTVERRAEQIAQDHGFTDITHTVEISGRCPSCATA